ncbi:MAG: adenylyltransferase/cytidyltransferase family protein [Bacteroidales bacterium]|nr:adenylyltransferase/cytidyltransferase family protein [Bacteroidales bacterium]
MKKKIIGYTTGVFDLFHIGHLNILKQAKEHCDYLIVGVSTDENVQNYKHKTPVIPYEQRAAIVAAIKYVDEVVPQKNMNKLEAWNELHYDVLFHGDDWKNSEMYNQVINDLLEVGVKVVFLKHTPNISTTDLENKIRN